MAKYDYHIIINREYKEGIVRAENYGQAKQRIKAMFPGMKVNILELMEHVNYFKQLYRDIANLLTVFLVKILPIAAGIVIIYIIIRIYAR